MNGLLQDFRHAARQLRRDSGFTLVAVLTLALGIGATTAIFSILDPLLLRKLPVERPDELVWITSEGSLGRAGTASSEIQSFEVYRSESQVLAGVLAFAPLEKAEISRAGNATSISREDVSSNFFAVLGARPYRGRFLEEGDGFSTTVISFDCWNRDFASDPNIVGRAVSLNDRLYTVAGVTQPRFFGVEVGRSPDFYLALDTSRTKWITVLGRLKHGMGLAQAQSVLASPFQQAMRVSSIPEVERREFVARLALVPAGKGLSELRPQFSLPGRILMAVVGLLLLIACSNVASLLLARALVRRRETYVRAALGAGRARLIRKAVAESAVIAAISGFAGLLLAHWAGGLLVASLNTQSSSVVLRSALDFRVLIFAGLVAGFAVILCGLIPALWATRVNLADGLKVQDTDADRGSRFGASRYLVVGQVAVSVVLLTVAGLLLRSLVNLETFNPGFDRKHVLTVSMVEQAGRSGAQIEAFHDQLLQRVKVLPDVRSASYSGFTPVSGREIGINVAIEGHALTPGEDTNVRFVGVSPEYFETLGIPLLAGRGFTSGDDHQPYRVAILNQTMAKRFFGNESPIGKRLRMVETDRPPLEIVGVVADSKYKNLREQALEFFYLPSGRGPVLEVRVEGDPGRIAGSVRSLIQSMDGAVTIAGIRTLQDQIGDSLRQDRLVAGLCGAFSVLALVLTAIGLYGALAFRVAQRTREIGVRMALGADKFVVMRMVLGQAARLVFVGLAIGIAISSILTRLLASQLFGVSTTDPITFAAVTTLLTGIGVTACYIPARRATKVDPMVALRYE
jgi:predicted permease